MFENGNNKKNESSSPDHDAAICIGLAKGGEGEALASLFLRSVRETGSLAYNARQVDAWAARCPAPGQFDRLLQDGRERWLLQENGRIAAFLDLGAEGHIDLLYCDPLYAGRGRAALLYQAMEDNARRRGVLRLTSHASELARRFFLRQGFQVLERRDFTIPAAAEDKDQRPVAIHNFAVEKQL